MKYNLDRFLLAILWMTIVILGACFWFNAIFAFDIFSGSHWQYLAGMQASRIPVAPGFYFSIVAVVMIAVMGLYIIFRKRLRKIRLPMFDIGNNNNKNEAKPVKQTSAESTPQSATAPMAATMPATEPMPAQPAKQTQVPAPSQSGVDTIRRPPRLNLGPLPTTNSYSAAPAATPHESQQSRFAPTATPHADAANIREITQIFESAGYTPKGTPRIKGMQTAIIAIAPDEVLWIGAVGATRDAMHTAVDTLARVFSDTLDDIEIDIHAFIISSPDVPVDTDDTIMQFDDINELRRYMNAHPVESATDEDGDDGGFDAYSAYISTVIDYIGKI